MKKKYVILIVVILILSPILFFASKVFKTAWELENKYSNLVDQEAKEIVLINIGKGDRAYIAQLIDTVSSFQPKVLILNAHFPKYNNSVQDSLLLSSIENGHVLLKTKHQGMSHYGTHQVFLKRAKDYSFFEFFLDEEREVHDFYLYRITNEKKVFNLAYKAVQLFNSNKATSYLKENVSQPQLMVISRMPEYLKTYDFQDFSFSEKDLKEKIVILGYLGPESEDKFATKVGLLMNKSSAFDPDTYGTQLLANQILMILEGRD